MPGEIPNYFEMEIQTLERINALEEALYSEWLENHDRKCGVAIKSVHSCNWPMPSVLQREIIRERNNIKQGLKALSEGRWKDWDEVREDVGFIVG